MSANQDISAGTADKGTSAFKAPRLLISDHALPWLAPLLAILIVFALYPFFYNIWLSFHEFVPRKRALEFVGTANWEKLFADSRMWGALGITLLYTAVCLVVQLVLGMAIALLLDSDDPGFGFLRGVLTLTLVIPPRHYWHDVSAAGRCAIRGVYLCLAASGNSWHLAHPWQFIDCFNWRDGG